MTQADTCTYEIDIDELALENAFDDLQINLDEGSNENRSTWSCPHTQTANDSVCIFHKSVDQKQDEEVVKELVNILNTTTEDLSPHELEFIGAEFGELDIRNCTLDWDHNDPLIFEQATFHEAVSLPTVLFKNRVQFVNAEFQNAVDLPSTVESRVSFNAATFHDELLGYGTSFESMADFSGVIFNETADLAETRYNDRVDFSWTEFRDLGHFWQARFEKRSDFHQARFETAVFAEAEAAEKMRFTLTEFISTATFERATMNSADFSESNLTEVLFSNSTFQNANFESAIMSRAALMGADLRGCKFNGAVLGDAQIDTATRFLGNPSTEVSYSSHTIDAIREQLCCVYDPRYNGETDDENIDKARRTYRMIEELAGKAGLSRLQSQCFVRRQDLQKEEYKSDTLTAQSWEERLIAGIRYSRAKIARITLLYGESPWRIIGGSIIFIVLIAFIYPIGGWLQPVGQAPITYEQMINGDWGLFIESLYFSTLTFTTLGMGDYTPLGFGQVLATLNTAFGAILIALLVFVLGRRAAR